MNPQERADRLRIFQQELADIEREQVLELSEDQRARLGNHLETRLRELAAHYDVDTTESERKMSLGMRIASALGGLALCVAVVLFFNRYLGFWPIWVQVTLLGSVPLLLCAGAEYAARREKTLYYAALMSVVAVGAFVANLSMLGMIFNLAPTPNSLAVWGLFALALAYQFGVRLLLAAGLVWLLGWVTATSSALRGWWWLEFDRQPEGIILLGLVITLAPFVIPHSSRPDFPAVYRLVGTLAVFLPMVVLSAAGHTSSLSLAQVDVERLYQVLGLLSSAAAVWLGIRRGWMGVVNTGTVFFTIFLLFRLMDWWWKWMPKYLFFLLIGLVAIALVVVFKHLRGRARSAA